VSEFAADPGAEAPGIGFLCLTFFFQKESKFFNMRAKPASFSSDFFIWWAKPTLPFYLLFFPLPAGGAGHPSFLFLSSFFSY
jgi:hypothetical protein